MDKNIKITVVYGGKSTEREISLKSGEAVYNGLCEYGFTNVTLFDLQDNVDELLAMKPDIVYMALHGKGGEDGCLQGMLELAGIAYTGPGVASSAICMNKIYTKQILKAAGIPTADYMEVHKSEIESKEALARRIINEVGIPVVLKSPCQGSSIGVVIVKEESQMEEAIEEIFKYGDELLAETFISGPELTLPIIGNEEIIPLPDIEITSEREFYDYKAKYTSGLCHHIIPSRIDDKTRSKVIDAGIKAYRKLGLCGISRIDFMVDEKLGPIIIEVNTAPGMTNMSLVPDAARAVGIEFPELVSKILEYGLNAKRG